MAETMKESTIKTDNNSLCMCPGDFIQIESRTPWYKRLFRWFFRMGPKKDTYTVVDNDGAGTLTIRPKGEM